LTMRLNLAFKDGLYYCPTNVFTICPALPLVDPSDSPCPLVPAAARVLQERRTVTTRQPSRYQPTSKGKQLESELWLLRLGSPGVSQLDLLPGNVD
jgi:hypothetical protein